MDARQQPPRPIAFAPPFIDEATIQAVERVLRSGWITTGPETAAFERELAAYAQVDHVLCGGSWTGLAGVILDWFGVGPGDEVILPSYTYCATANVVLHRGAEPVMVDLPGGEQADGFNLTWEAILPHLTPRTKVVMPVDIGGWPVQVAGWTEALSAWSAEHGFDARGEVQERLGRPLLLSDAAHSLGALIGNAPAASLADIAVFSFHAVKNLTTAEGGAAAISLPPSFDGAAVHATLRTGLLHGQSKDAAAKFQSNKAGAWRYDVERPGFKCNMTDIQAAMGRVALTRYPEDLARRKALCDRYDAAFSGWHDALLPLRSNADRTGSDHLYPLRLPRLSESQRDRLIDRLSADSIATNVHFQPLPLLTAHASRGERIEDHPHALSAYACEISLPVHLHLTLEDVDRVAAAVRQGHGDILREDAAS
ncbi:MAG: DegT/DnrJ/EryC1/StrS family aminotransferase [Flavobacteriales bacterium]